MWVLPLKPLLATAGDKGGASGGRVVLDAVGFGSKATWQKITKKDAFDASLKPYNNLSVFCYVFKLPDSLKSKVYTHVNDDDFYRQRKP